jgi:hypothetical protein
LQYFNLDAMDDHANKLRKCHDREANQHLC